MTLKFKPRLGAAMALTALLIMGNGAIATPLDQGNPTVFEPPERAIAMAPDTLESVIWQLVSYRGPDGATVNAFSDREATFQFREGQVGGTTGCNRFFNSYTLDGNTLSISPGGTTLMACFPEALAQQEAAILAGLPLVTTYQIDGEQLTLLDSNGAVLFTLTVQQSAQLIDTLWTLSVYNNGRGGLTTPLAGTTITATFDDDKGLVGTAGCNNYIATYEIDGSTLQVGPAISTRRYCAQPEGVMEQESAFLSRLEAVATYTISGNQLELKDADGTPLLRFTSN